MQIKYGVFSIVSTLLIVASALTTGDAAAAAQGTQAKADQADQAVTVTGCVVREADYRKTQGAGKGGAVGTGVGVGNEFVLTGVSTTPASGAAPTGTSGGDATLAYELTGANEARAEQFVGKRVEISGTLKRAETSAGAATGGPTAGKPPSGVDVTSSDLKLRELEVTSVKASAAGTCPAP